MSDQELKQIARRWFDAIRTGDTNTLDEIVAPDVVDHSGLSEIHGPGLEGHKKLFQKLRQTFSGWESTIKDITVDGDLVIVDHSGRGSAPAALQSLVGSEAPINPAANKVDFQVRSCVRVSNGKIVEHWAMEGPFGRKSAPDYANPGSTPAPYPSAGEPTSSPEENKIFMQRYVKNVIDGQNPALTPFYFAPNFYNHDRAPGEQTGLQGVTDFITSIFAAFTGFQTSIDDQLAEDDLVVGRWSQSFTNTGPYLSFPASGKTVHISGITITRVRAGKIVEEWEARDAVALLVQMGVIQPLGALDDGTGDKEANEALAGRYMYEAWNSGNPDLIDELAAPDFVNHNLLLGQADGPAGLKQLIRGWRAAFPDMNVSVDLLISEGAKVAIRWTLNGTHLGRFLGIPATGKYVSIPGMTIFRIENGKLREAWGHWEQAGMLGQLGVVKFPDYPAAGTGSVPAGANAGTGGGGSGGVAPSAYPGLGQ